MLSEFIEKPARKKRKKRAAPPSSPLICVQQIAKGSHTLRFSDSLRPDSAAKAKGARALQVFAVVCDQFNAGVDEARYRAEFTRNPAVVRLEESEDGRIATYYARWISSRGETGPWSAPVSMRIIA